MYPYNMNNNYPLYYNQSTSLPPAENNHISYQHHQELYNYLVPSDLPAILENPINTLFFEAPISKDSTLNNSSSFNMNSQALTASKKVSGKRDRHTKICTAQGIRDRRVRLSISIAREFFRLQDMLGFDKASKTLGWLLEKSKAAIEEVTSSAKNEKEVGITLDSSVVPHNQDIVDKDKDDENYEDENIADDDKKELGAKSSKGKGTRKEHCCSDQNVTKETRRMMRVKARERARERTKRKKIVIANNSNQPHQLGSLSTHQNDHQHEQNLMFLQSISPAATMASTSSSYGMMNNGVCARESVVIRSKSPRRLSSYNCNYNNNLMSKDDQWGYYNDYYNDYLAKLELESTNNSGIIHQPPGLSALNIINLSTEIHINAKPWDTNFSNRNMH